jgi:hypothetical protein
MKEFKAQGKATSPPERTSISSNVQVQNFFIVAYPGCLSRLRDPESEFFYHGG